MGISAKSARVKLHHPRQSPATERADGVDLLSPVIGSRPSIPTPFVASQARHAALGRQACMSLEAQISVRLFDTRNTKSLSHATPTVSGTTEIDTAAQTNFFRL